MTYKHAGAHAWAGASRCSIAVLRCRHSYNTTLLKLYHHLLLFWAETKQLGRKDPASHHHLVYAFPGSLHLTDRYISRPRDLYVGYQP